MSNAGRTGTSGSGGLGRGCSWLRSSSGGSGGTNRSHSFSEKWKLWFHLRKCLSKEGRPRKVGYARVATFYGVPGDPDKNFRWVIPPKYDFAEEFSHGL